MTQTPKGRRSVKREKLSPLIESYLLVLENRRGLELLDAILSLDVHLQLWPSREPDFIGLPAVRERIAHIRNWGASVHLIRMTDHGDCVKADFNFVTSITSGDSRIFQVIGMYDVRDNLITHIREAWPIRRGRRDGGPPPQPEPLDGGKGRPVPIDA